MGALHEGHLSLVSKSNNTCKNTIVSIYINPAQFAQGEDLDTYPKTIKSDLDKLSNYKVDCIFLPGNTEMYPDGINAGNYNAYIQDVNGCVDTSAISVNEINNADISLNITHTTCYNSCDGEVIASLTNGSGNYNYN